MEVSKKFAILYFLVSVIFLHFSALSNQVPNQNETKDSMIYCFKYNFKTGDTLVYLVHSYDSILIDFGKPLLKVRNEIYQVVCEKANKSGTFLLSIELLEFKGRDFQDTNFVEYFETDWKNRKIQIEIDSLGNRMNFWVDDSSKSGRAPGGPFQPHLFFAINETCKKKNETWLVRVTEDLPENGIPVPRINHTMLFKMVGELDTLGETVIRSEFIRTGQGSLKLQHQKNLMKVSAVINAYGFIDISKLRSVPVHLFTTVEQKLSFKTDDTESVGRHYIHTDYTLIDYREAPPVIKSPKKRKR
jgi:hypothetical protein